MDVTAIEVLFLVLVAALVVRNVIKDRSDGRSITGGWKGGKNPEPDKQQH